GGVQTATTFDWGTTNTQDNWMVALLADSGVVASHRGPDCNRVQDAYSLRCSPQVHGAARDTVEHAATVAARELAA
ncbi:MAG TPA: aromatic amino acid lyase, partial [Nocardioides sp.]|nr:aromatic amino acid lyase [Nocardioides sp.]